MIIQFAGILDGRKPVQKAGCVTYHAETIDKQWINTGETEEEQPVGGENWEHVKEWRQKKAQPGQGKILWVLFFLKVSL